MMTEFTCVDCGAHVFDFRETAGPVCQVCEWVSQWVPPEHQAAVRARHAETLARMNDDDDVPPGGGGMTEQEAWNVVHNFKAYPKDIVSEAAMLVLENEAALSPEDLAEACAAMEWTLPGKVVMSEEELRDIATRVVRAVVPVANEAVLAMLIDDLAQDIEAAIANWLTKPHPLAGGRAA